MNEKARILIFTGQGKGKTTAALGMAFRASGHGLRVLIIQFIKKTNTGEIKAADETEYIKIIQTGMGFLPETGSDEYIKHKQSAEQGMQLASESIESGCYDLVILDEICVAVDKGLLKEKDVIEILEKAGSDMSVVLTGRNATTGLIKIADTVSNIECVKHGYDHGVEAQKGVEF